MEYLKLLLWDFFSSINIVTRLRFGRPGFYLRQGQGFFSSPPRPDRLWDPLSLLFNVYRGFLYRGKAAGA